MKKPEMIELISLQAGVRKLDVEQVYDAIIEYWKKELLCGENVVITGLGTFRIHNRQTKKGINPRTGEIITVAPRKAITFKPSISLKKALDQEENGK